MRDRGSFLPDRYFEDDLEGADELDAFIRAVHGADQIVDDNGVVWGRVRSFAGMDAYVRVGTRRMRAPFRWIRDWWRGGAIVALFLAILLVGGVR